MRYRFLKKAGQSIANYGTLEKEERGTGVDRE